MPDPEWLILARNAEDCFIKKQWPEAVALGERAVALNPKCAIALQAIGMSLTKMQRPLEAIGILEQALAIRPNLVASHNFLGRCYSIVGDLDRAELEFDRALCIQPEHPHAHLNRAAVWLMRGDYHRGWIEYEWRWPCGAVARTEIPRPMWDGSPLAGRSILIHTEQGMGDVLQFMRFLPLVKQQSGKLVFACQKAMQELLRPTTCVDRWFPIDEPGEIDFDLYSPLLTLPALLDVDDAMIRQPVPYVFADQQRVEKWRKPVEALNGFKVGICWQGSPTFEGDRFRSIPLKHFAALAKVPSATLISLQISAGLEQIPANKDALRLHVLGELDQQSAFVDRAAIIEHLDLIITSDTSLAHLAGAMGKRVWVVLSTASDWRWLMEREDSPWYPTMRLFRQKTLDDWPEVFARVAAELMKVVKEKR